ncbi:MAG TPA: type III pantothenate kinase [Gammaproteobacteria bacterium]|nr:type III pantothenate kinase [Gammaproteobacteria bacterium]
MILLVDIGNARIKWAVQEGESWTAGEPLPRQKRAFKDIARPAWKELETPTRVIISNVAGDEYRKSVHTWVKRRWKIAPEFLPVNESLCGVSNAYPAPERLGADRWAALLAVHAHYKGPSVVVDCGTAITIDAITAEGVHKGGLIVPGMELMTDSLGGGIAPGIQLEASPEPQVSLLGRSTETAVMGGVLYTAIALIDRAFLDLRAALGRHTNLVLTGGDADRVHELLESRPQLEPELVLKGLAVYAQETA